MLVTALWVAGMLAYQLPGPGWVRGVLMAVWAGFAVTTAVAVARARVGRARCSCSRWWPPVCGGCC
jgi:hypothetical protein